MMYFDTAFIAKCYLNEHDAANVRRAAFAGDGLASCRLGRVEFWSVLRRHLREGRLSAKDAARIRAQLRADEAAGVWTWFPVTGPLLDAACERLETMPRRQALGAADAIHLACACLHGFTEICTNDAQMLRAAPLFGLKGRDLTTPLPE